MTTREKIIVGLMVLAVGTACTRSSLKSLPDKDLADPNRIGFLEYLHHQGGRND